MGGNVFKGKTTSIKIDHIEPTVERYFDELKKVFPKKANIFNKRNFKYLGSVGKKPLSGDIDFGIDVSKIVDSKISDESIKEWGINPADVMESFNKFKKRARTASDEQLMMRAMLQNIVNTINDKSPNIYCDPKKVTHGNIFGLYPQFDADGNRQELGVQIDWMVGNLKWLEFSYYSNVYKGNVKGLHRTQLILSMFDYLGLTFNHVTGVSDKVTKEVLATNPYDAIKILEEKYNIKISKNDSADYFNLIEIVKKLPKKKREGILDIYLKILDKTRADIPTDLQDYWRKNQSRLGLTGKFLPDDSLLKECVIPETFRELLEKL